MLLRIAEPCLHYPTRDACRRREFSDADPFIRDHAEEVRPRHKRWMLTRPFGVSFEGSVDVEQYVCQSHREWRASSRSPGGLARTHLSAGFPLHRIACILRRVEE